MRTVMIVLMLSCAGAGSAWAQTNNRGGAQLSLDAAGSKVVGDLGDGMDFGFGFGARAGYAIRTGEVFLVPELELAFTRWGTVQAVQDQLSINSVYMLSLMPGARLQYDQDIVRFTFGFHLGLVHAGADCDSCKGEDHFGLSFGPSLEFAAAPGVTLGPFINFSMASAGNSNPEWVLFGLGGTFDLAGGGATPAATPTPGIAQVPTAGAAAAPVPISGTPACEPVPGMKGAMRCPGGRVCHEGVCVKDDSASVPQ